MKEVRALWVEKLALVESINCGSFDELINEYNYIGYVDGNNCRYMIVSGGFSQGLAVSPAEAYTPAEFQKYVIIGKYYVFDSVKELYQWMMDE